MHFFSFVFIKSSKYQYVSTLIPTNQYIKNSDKFIAGAAAGVTAVSMSMSSMADGGRGWDSIINPVNAKIMAIMFMTIKCL